MLKTATLEFIVLMSVFWMLWEWMIYLGTVIY